MRMGKLSKRERIGKNYPEKRPEFASAGMNVGVVSTNTINSVYLPLWKDMAEQSMQEWLQNQIDYDEAVTLAETNSTVEIPDEPRKPVFHSQYKIDDFTETLEETAKHFSTLNGWKVHANAARFERRLDEKYGIFRPFITEHPEVEVFVRGMQRKWAMGYFKPFRNPPIARSTSIILLFMMQRQKMAWQIMVLATLFLLIGLQPWALVVVVAVFRQLLERRRRKVMGKMDSAEIPIIEAYYKESAKKEEKLFEPVGQKLSDSSDDIDMSEFDTLILGGGPSALYTAALLSRAGRTVLVLSQTEDASGCLTLAYCKDSSSTEKQFRQVPFDVDSCNISRIQRQQELLVPALCTSTDYQGGIRFSQIGSDADGYAFEVLSIPGMGAAKADDQIPFVLRANGGLAGLMDDTARFLGDGWPGFEDDVGNSLAGAYVSACNGMNSSASDYFLSKVIPDSANELRSKSTYQEASIRYAANFLNQCFPLNAHVRALFAGIGMKNENIKPTSTSMGAHVTNICAAVSGQGMHYPLGGPRALCHALATVIEQCGGKIVTDVAVKDLIFEDKEIQKAAKEGEASPDPPRCLGVKLVGDRKIMFPANRPDDPESLKDVVVSTTGFMDTFIKWMPPEIRTAYKVPIGLPALTERRPLWKVLFALRGSAQELDITGADYYRLPSASLPFDEIDSNTGAITLGVIGGKDDDDEGVGEVVPEGAINAPAAESSTEKAERIKGRSKFYVGESWMKVSFPSAKDPTFAERHGNISTCVVTVEVDDDFVTMFDAKPKIFSGVKRNVESSEAANRLVEKVLKDLVGIYPQLEGKIVHGEMRGPFKQGLSHNPERYAAKGIRPDTTYPNLFVGGSDLTIGDSFSGGVVAGWLTANAVMGYTTVDHLFLEKNITSDLERFIETPDDLDEEDVAVAYSPPIVEEAEAEIEQSAGEAADLKKDL